MSISTMIKNVDTTGERVVIRGEIDGKVIFYNYLDDGDCLVEKLKPNMRLVVEIERR